jgi:ssDNA-specific exonuclease RecJ
MIRRAKGLELMKIVFITNLSTFGSKVFFTLKFVKFENVSLTKVVHGYVIKGMNA